MLIARNRTIHCRENVQFQRNENTRLTLLLSKRAYHIVEKTEGKNEGTDHVAHHSSITSSTSRDVEKTMQSDTERIASHAEVEALQTDSERYRSLIRLHSTLPSCQENDCVLSFHFRCRRRSAKNTSTMKRCQLEF